MPQLKRISVDIQIRAGKDDIIDTRLLTRIAEEEFKKAGIKVIDHEVMINSPEKGDGIYYFREPRYGGGSTYVWLLVWSKYPVDNPSIEYYWGFTRASVRDGMGHNLITDEELVQQYRQFVQSTAQWAAESIVKAQIGEKEI